MKAWKKAVICISLSLMCVFSSIGYASLSKNFIISGNIFAERFEPEGFYISSIKIHAQSGVSNVNAQPVYPTNAQTDLTVLQRNGYVTYEITVTNKTDMTYWYLGIDALSSVQSNALINTSGGIIITTMDNESASAGSFNTSDWVPPHTERTFYATYRFGDRAQGDISNLINFSFGLQMRSFSDGFLKVLNDKASPYGYYYLADAFNDNFAENGSTVIGNVGDDAEIFNNLFGASLSINVDGEELPVTILVERVNVDGKTGTGDSYTGNGTPVGCEYTVYITTDSLGKDDKKATVYAVSYTCGPDGTWYMIGELYEGACTVEDYDTSTQKHEGSFDVDSWTATQKDYNVIDGVSYKVGYTTQGTEYDRYTTIEQLMSKFDQELYNKVNNNSQTLLKAVCTTLYSYKHQNGQYIESVNYNNMTNPGYAELKNAFDRLKPYCYIGNGAQEVKLQNANALSRAELIQMLEAIQMTYDYYLAVNPK